MELRAWRQQEGYTLDTVAKMLNTTIATVSRLETRERRTVRAKMVDKIFDLTTGNVTANDLYGITPRRLREMKKKRLAEKKHLHPGLGKDAFK